VADGALPSFSKKNHSWETHFVALKLARLDMATFQKALDAAPINLLSRRSEFEPTGFEKLLANSKGFGSKLLRTY
jgi:hypothetical protein